MIVINPWVTWLEAYLVDFYSIRLQAANNDLSIKECRFLIELNRFGIKIQVFDSTFKGHKIKSRLSMDSFQEQL